MVMHADIHPCPIEFECDYRLCSRIRIRFVSMILLISVVFSRVVRSEYSRDSSYYSQCFKNALEKKPLPPVAPPCSLLSSK